MPSTLLLCSHSMSRQATEHQVCLKLSGPLLLVNMQHETPLKDVVLSYSLQNQLS